jgi:hypothetical protein
VLGGVILLTRCDPTDMVSALAARRLDRMIGRQCPRRQGPITHEPSAAPEMLRQMYEGVNRIRSSKPPIGAGRQQALDPAFLIGHPYLRCNAIVYETPQPRMQADEPA